MGGIGSNRWKQHQARPIAEQSLALALNQVIRCLIAASSTTNGQSHRIVWYQGNQKIAACQMNIEYAANSDRLMRVVYQANGQHIEDRISVEFVPQPLGGQRAWWLCPICRRRCCVLYAPGAKRWRCRICAGITYTSSNMSDPRVTEMLRDPDLVSALKRVYEGLSLSHLILRQKVETIIRRRAHREARRWFRRTFPGRHLPMAVRRGDDVDTK